MINSGIAYIDFDNITIDMQTATTGTVSGSITNARKYIDKIQKAVNMGKTICCKNVHITVPSASDFLNVDEIFNGYFFPNLDVDEEGNFMISAVRGCGGLAPNARRQATVYIEHDALATDTIYFNMG